MKSPRQTHYAEGNNMASPTQTVVGKSIPNPLIPEDLLKIIKDLIPSLPPKPLPILVHRMVGPQKVVFIFLMK